MISIEEDQAIQATSEIQMSTKASNDDMWRKIDLTRTESIEVIKHPQLNQ